MAFSGYTCFIVFLFSSFLGSGLFSRRFWCYYLANGVQGCCCRWDMQSPEVRLLSLSLMHLHMDLCPFAYHGQEVSHNVSLFIFVSCMGLFIIEAYFHTWLHYPHF
ncbi:uncharacterized protein B0T23DRAFT_50536 [Neurospora hispaniola]|uniref:Uncharacterized protein n=1 Tax=Neurospora hispaniola TaxID=588809 RepID=A0AAJ0HZ28_9PEZI|nr:hypothetical protein B0T23DRAFT_50536 [Neurospora hispaniola]